ncbi:MAG: hypothetical protein M5U27_02695 [Gaiella sp.]|nr:hypothetical protein [Gaiella sp.]
MSGVDALTGTYRLPCPSAGSSRVLLSSFREIERLAGSAHPAVYRVVFRCDCGEDHVALVGHDALDWSPLGLDDDATYLNLMTSRRDGLASELAGLASAHIGRGEWPWCFFCYLENALRPVTPSAFRLLAPASHAVAVAVRCPACGSTSVNLVTRPHLDVPFHTDARIGVVAHVFEGDALRTREAFRAELQSSSFDEKRLRL